MNCGNGKWQRAILEALNKFPAWYLNTLLPPGFTRPQYVALLRAAHSLADQGRIELDQYVCWAGEPGRLVVKRPGFYVAREAVRSLNVDKVTLGELVNNRSGARP